MSKNTSLFLVASGLMLSTGTALGQAEDEAPQDVFIVEPEQQQQQGYPTQQQTQQGYPAQQQQQAQPAPQGYQPGQPAQQGAPVYAQPYQPQAQYAPQPLQGRRLRAPYIEGAPMPPGGVLIERRRTGLIVSGAVMFGAPWITTLLVAVGSEEGALGIPVVGPLLYLGRGASGADTMLVFDTLLQGAGLTMFILGMVLKRRYVEYYAENEDNRRWSLLPQVGTTNGLQLDMRF